MRAMKEDLWFSWLHGFPKKITQIQICAIMGVSDKGFTPLENKSFVKFVAIRGLRINRVDTP